MFWLRYYGGYGLVMIVTFWLRYYGSYGLVITVLFCLFFNISVMSKVGQIEDVYDSPVYKKLAARVPAGGISPCGRPVI